MRSNEEIVTIIEERTKEKGMSLSELARQVDMAKSAISRYFNRTREFPLNRVNEFAKFLDCFNTNPHITTQYSLLDLRRFTKFDQRTYNRALPFYATFIATFLTAKQ